MPFIDAKADAAAIWSLFGREGDRWIWQCAQIREAEGDESGVRLTQQIGTHFRKLVRAARAVD